MISWEPACRFLRHFNTGTIRIPIGSFFTNFKINTIEVHEEEIVIHLFEKNHYLLEKDALQTGTIRYEEGYSGKQRHGAPLQ